MQIIYRLRKDIMNSFAEQSIKVLWSTPVYSIDLYLCLEKRRDFAHCGNIDYIQILRVHIVPPVLFITFEPFHLNVLLIERKARSYLRSDIAI